MIPFTEKTMESVNTAGSWNKTTRIVVLSTVLILIGLFFQAIRSLIAPLTVAALSAYALRPLQLKLESRDRISHGGATALVYFPFLIVLIATPGTIVPILVGQIETLANELVRVMGMMEDQFTNTFVIFGRTISQDQWAGFIGSLTNSFTPAAEDAIHFLEATSTSLIWLIVILVTIYYMLLDWEGLRAWFMRLFPPPFQSDLTQLIAEIDKTWRAYLRGTLALMFIVGIFFIITGLAIGLPGAVALGLLTGLLSIVPEIGPAVAGVISATVAFFEGSNFLPLSNFWFAILIGVIYIVVMQVKSLWLRPMVMGRFMHMNTGLVFVAIIGSALISGVLAALVVLPVMATVGQIGYYIRCRLFDLDPWQEAVDIPSAVPETAPSNANV